MERFNLTRNLHDVLALIARHGDGHIKPTLPLEVNTDVSVSDDK